MSNQLKKVVARLMEERDKRTLVTKVERDLVLRSEAFDNRMCRHARLQIEMEFVRARKIRDLQPSAPRNS
jgi:hypothetical protein